MFSAIKYQPSHARNTNKACFMRCLSCRGQQITSDQSHKSYRPVTVLFLRIANKLGQFLPKGKHSYINRVHACLCCTRHAPQCMCDSAGVCIGHDNSGGLNATPFHIASAAVHAINSCLVFRYRHVSLCTKAHRILAAIHP